LKSLGLQPVVSTPAFQVGSTAIGQAGIATWRRADLSQGRRDRDLAREPFVASPRGGARPRLLADRLLEYFNVRPASLGLPGRSSRARGNRRRGTSSEPGPRRPIPRTIPRTRG